MKKNQFLSNNELDKAFEQINSAFGEKLDVIVETINKLGAKKSIENQNTRPNVKEDVKILAEAS